MPITLVITLNDTDAVDALTSAVTEAEAEAYVDDESAENRAELTALSHVAGALHQAENDSICGNAWMLVSITKTLKAALGPNQRSDEAATLADILVSTLLRNAAKRTQVPR